MFQKFGDVGECVKDRQLAKCLLADSFTTDTCMCNTLFGMCSTRGGRLGYTQTRVHADLGTRNTQDFLKSHLYSHCIE